MVVGEKDTVIRDAPRPKLLVRLSDQPEFIRSPDVVAFRPKRIGDYTVNVLVK